MHDYLSYDNSDYSLLSFYNRSRFASLRDPQIDFVSEMRLFTRLRRLGAVKMTQGGLD